MDHEGAANIAHGYDTVNLRHASCMKYAQTIENHVRRSIFAGQM